MKNTKSDFDSGKESFYDDEKELFYCYVGVKDSNRTLFAAVYGNTPVTALKNAIKLSDLLNKKDETKQPHSNEVSY